MPCVVVASRVHPTAPSPAPSGSPLAVIEVYPYAAFVTLLGHRPRAKSDRQGLAARVRALRQAGVEWDDYFDHDSLDALAAGLTGWRYLQGRASAVGDPREGLLWLPVPRGGAQGQLPRLTAREAGRLSP